jgi:predicted membrane GTPase involved in stress response
LVNNKLPKGATMKSLRYYVNLIEAAELDANDNQLEAKYPAIYKFLLGGYGSDTMKKAQVNFDPLSPQIAVIVELPVDEYNYNPSHFLVKLEQQGIEYEVLQKGRYVIQTPDFRVNTTSTGNQTTFYFKLK